jgi:hypothetical protein
MFGADFENYKPPAPEEDVPAPAPVSSAPGVDAAVKPVDKGKKGKVSAKNTGLTYQFQIMESIGILRSEIKKFADPYYWCSYFPPIAKVCFALSPFHLILLGSHLSPTSRRTILDSALVSIGAEASSQRT